MSQPDADRLALLFDADPAAARAALAQAAALRESLYAIFGAVALHAEPDRAPVERLVDAYRVALGDAQLVAGG